MTAEQLATIADEAEELMSLPEGWRLVRLGDVCDIQLGKMLSPTSKTGEHSRPYLRNANVQWNRFDLSDVAEMDFSESEEQKFALRHGDLLVCEGGEPGRAAVWEEQIKPCFYQKALHRVRPLTDSIDPKFLMYRLWLGAGNGEFLDSHAQTTIAHLPAVRLLEFVLAIPRVEEQWRIATVLDDRMSAVEQARHAVEEQFEAAKLLPGAFLRSVFESEETQDWPKRKLGEFLALRKEVVHPRDDPKGKALFVGLEHVESGTGRRIGAIEVEKEKLTGRKPQFYKGDIVYGYLRPYLNKLWVAEFDGLCSVDQYVYSVNTSEADLHYLAYFMLSPVYLETAPIDATPGQLPRIRTEEVATVELKLPPLERQRKIVEHLNDQLQAVESIKLSLTAQLEAIEKVPAALLRKAFAGEV